MIGTVSLGSNRRSDGQWGMNAQNWGAGSPLGDSRLPSDNFIMASQTRASLVAGQKYTMTVRADDGYRIWAHKIGGGAFNITSGATSGVWQKDAYGYKTIEFTAPESGTFDLHAWMFEQSGNSYFDLSWNSVGNYLPDLSSWSESQWNIAAGDNTRITGIFWGGETNETGYTDHEDVLATYNDLSRAILGAEYRSSAGYVLDPSYRWAPDAGVKYGWHSGIDIDTPNNVDTGVRALVGGTVRVVQDNYHDKFLEVAGDDGRFYRYGHLKSLNVRSGRVEAGSTIGVLGSSISNHLHFQVNRSRDKPAGYSPFNQESVYQWTLNPLQVFWTLKNEGKI